MSWGPETFAARVADDAMAPELPRGAWAFVDPDEPMAPGRLVGVADPDGGAAVRRLVAADGALLLRARDGRPDVALTRDNETMVLGTVVFVGNAV